MEKLAIFGGDKVKTTPFGTGKRFGDEELQQLKEALEQNTLFYWFGGKVKQFLEKFKTMYGAEYAVATSSGTSAIHVALGAAGVGPGDEVITSPITDMGSIIGIVFQNAIPVFADLDPHTYNMTAETIAAKITDKTKAVVVVHLAGNPAEMDPIMELCRPRGIKVIEDCAQSYECFYKGRRAGTIGDFGCFSLNDFKHISAGDGGMILMHNEEDYVVAHKFADKNYNRFSKNPQELRKIEYIAPNYRMNELTGAVAIAQLDRLPWICERRNELGERLTAGIKDLPGIQIHEVKEGNKSSYWFYMFRIDEKAAGVNRADFAAALTAEGIPASVGYLPACVYEYDMFKNLEGFRGTHVPFNLPEYGREIKYASGDCPVAEEILETSIRLNISEFYTEQDIDDIIAAFKKICAHYAK